MILFLSQNEPSTNTPVIWKLHQNIAVNDINDEFKILSFTSENINNKINMTIKSHYRKETQQPKTSPET